ncbi:hypothetical protein [Ralstonia holmesii]|uniref:Uncharacterized protein n=1 Tax=Ralstonia holmesii TaxID=3058602 RepID=A0ABC8QKR5_9RALS|nr:hypothetical protein [Ralstonia sp. LMG 32967]CAJ0797018.1 hypothetical protein LMG18096_03343 [Ralstonia sp. LMG 32967]CAJ0806024.1 hypothetical protein LMG18093_00113 [Ralstonia sp. LMG 32967]
MNDLPYLNFQLLERLALQSDAVQTLCDCTKTSLAGWASLPVSFPEGQLQRVGTLIQGNVDEATFAEFLPNGTGYWSDNAPIAPFYFPYNRSDVWECTACRRIFLRYTEGGGYFVDQRIRVLTQSLLVDAALP